MKRSLKRPPTLAPRGAGGLTLRRAAAVAALCWVGAGLACSSEDDLGDDPLGDDPLGEADDGAASGAAGSASTGGGGAAGGALTGGAAGRDGVSASGSGGSPTGSATEPDPDEQTPSAPPLDDGAAAGESGIFVGMTAAHNAARAALDVDPPLPDLSWSSDLALVAQDWADRLTATECGAIEHRQPNMYGENIAMRGSSRLVEPFSPEEAVAGWDAEVACWEYGTIARTESCDIACVQGLNSNGCGHYTQLIWRNTERVGCGYSTCDDGTFTYEVWVCNYDPPGNFIGQTPY